MKHCTLLIVLLWGIAGLEVAIALQSPKATTSPQKAFSSQLASSVAQVVPPPKKDPTSIAMTAFHLLTSTAAISAVPALSPSSSSSVLIPHVPEQETYIPATVPQQQQQQQSSTEGALWKLALAGAMATILSDTAMHPIDCIKTLQQTDQGMGLSLSAAASYIHAQLGGLSGFYRGFGTYVVCDAVGGAIKFGTYESLKRTASECFQKNDKDEADSSSSSSSSSSWPLFGCAAMSFITSSSIAVPGELLKQQLQLGHYSGCMDALTSIWAQSGLAGFYQGYEGVFLRDVPYTAMELGLYDLFKSLFVTERNKNRRRQAATVGDDAAEDDNHVSTMEQIMLAGLTGGFVGCVTTPLDTIKTKLMVDPHFQGASFFTALTTTVHDHGWTSLFCGADARVAWLVPLTAIYLPAYDVTKELLLSIGNNKEEEEASKEEPASLQAQ